MKNFNWHLKRFELLLYNRFRNSSYDGLLPPANKIWGKVMFLRARFLRLSVILFTGTGVSVPLHVGIHPLGRHPRADTPLGRHPLPTQTSPLDTTGYGQKRAVRILLEYHTCFNKFHLFPGSCVTVLWDNKEMQYSAKKLTVYSCKEDAVV